MKKNKKYEINIYIKDVGRGKKHPTDRRIIRIQSKANIGELGNRVWEIFSRMELEEMLGHYDDDEKEDFAEFFRR